MSLIEEQTEPLLRPNENRVANHRVSFVDRLRRGLQHLLTFILHWLFQIYEFLNKGNSDSGVPFDSQYEMEPSQTLPSETLIDIVDETNRIIEPDASEISSERLENAFAPDPKPDYSSLEPAERLAIYTEEINSSLYCESDGIAGVIILDNEPNVPFSSKNELASAPSNSISLTPHLHLPALTPNPVKISLSYHDETITRVRSISRRLRECIKLPNNSDLIFDVPNAHANMSVLDRRIASNKVYKQAALVVVFLSPTYHDCKLCYNDWSAITDRFMVPPKDQQSKRLLLVKLDEFDANALGLFKFDFFLDAKDKTDEEVAELIVKRWRTIEN